MPKRNDLTNKKFGKLTVLGRHAEKANFWWTQCECGKTTAVRSDNLKSATSCGCQKKVKKIKLEPQEAQRRHDHLLNPNAERHMAFERSYESAPQPAPAEREWRPTFRRGEPGEVVVIDYDRLGQPNRTRWVVRSASLKLTVCHLESDPTVTRTFRNEYLELTGRDAAGNEIKVEPREFTAPTGPQPKPSVTRLRSRLIGTQVHQIEVRERPGERCVRCPDGKCRYESEAKNLNFTPPMSLNEKWLVEVDGDKYKSAPISQRVFRPGESDDQGAIRIPRPVVDTKKH
jgi:hypothetical protein